MGVTKKHIHTQDQIDLANLFKALGHPARIAIIDNLLMHENLNCNDLRSYIQLAQSTISAHIKQLHDVGVLGVSVVANNAYYILNKVPVEVLANYVQQILTRIDILKKDRLFVYIKPQPIISLDHLKNTS